MSNFINEAVIGRSTFCIGGKVVDDSQNVNITAVIVDCSDYTTEEECSDTCYWYDDACHGKPKDEEEEIPWVLILGAAGVIIAGIVTIMIARR